MVMSHCCFCTDQADYLPTPRVHVPLAKKCTLGCRYCNYIQDGNISDSMQRPGVSVMTVSGYFEIEQYLSKEFHKIGKPYIIGVSGPGDPLENMENLTYLHEILTSFDSDIKLCICSNGRFFNKVKEEILGWKELEYFTVTVNTLHAKTAQKIYGSVIDENTADALISNQLSAVCEMHKSGRKVKINTVFMPEINGSEIETMFTYLQQKGADCFNLLPMVPTGSKYQYMLGDNETSSQFDLTDSYLRRCGFPLTCSCRQCRADFCGV